MDVDDAVLWSQWAWAQGVTKSTYAALAEVGGSERWWVRERPVRVGDWVALEFTHPTTGEFVRLDGDQLRKLAESSGRRRALDLPVTKAKRHSWVRPSTH